VGVSVGGTGLRRSSRFGWGGSRPVGGPFEGIGDVDVGSSGAELGGPGYRGVCGGVRGGGFRSGLACGWGWWGGGLLGGGLSAGGFFWVSVWGVAGGGLGPL